MEVGGDGKAGAGQHFISLLDNYVAETGVAETHQEHERVEMSAFLSACCRTRVMQYLGDYLKKKGKIKAEQELKAFLYDIWFKLYHREESKPLSLPSELPPAHAHALCAAGTQ